MISIECENDHIAETQNHLQAFRKKYDHFVTVDISLTPHKRKTGYHVFNVLITSETQNETIVLAAHYYLGMHMAGLIIKQNTGS